MSTHRSTLFATCVALALGLASAHSPASAITPEEKDPAAIMRAVYKRDEGDRARTRLQMVIKEAGGTEKSRTLRMFWLNFAEGIKRLVIFEAPGDIRNTGLLTFDYASDKSDDDQWLFLQSLHRTMRITTSKRSGSFMGSDFSYADITKPEPDRYVYKLEGTAVVEGEDCWLVSAKPVSPKVQEEIGYRQLDYWVSKKKLMILRQKLLLDDGQRVKYIKLEGVKQVSGIWTPSAIVARTMKAGQLQSETTLSTLEVAYGQADVDDALFTQARLEQGL